jgi:hypothetical protein
MYRAETRSQIRQPRALARGVASILRAAVLGAALFACARERVEVGDVGASGTPDEPPTGPMFPVTDGSATADGGPICGEPPTIGRCNDACAKGYVFENGKSTCTCCP